MSVSKYHSRFLLVLVVLAGMAILRTSSEPHYVKRRVPPRYTTNVGLVTEVVGYQTHQVTCSMVPCNIPDQTQVSWVVKNIVGTSVAIVSRDSCFGFCSAHCGALQPGCNRCAYC